MPALAVPAEGLGALGGADCARRKAGGDRACEQAVTPNGTVFAKFVPMHFMLITLISLVIEPGADSPPMNRLSGWARLPMGGTDDDLWASVSALPGGDA